MHLVEVHNKSQIVLSSFGWTMSADGSSLDQQCVDVVQAPGGPYECAKVYRSASCGCDTTTLRKTGSCTYVP